MERCLACEAVEIKENPDRTSLSPPALDSFVSSCRFALWRPLSASQARQRSTAWRLLNSFQAPGAVSATTSA